MNFDELNKIVAKEANVSICPVCGVPFTKYHWRQATCASDECRKAHRAEYLKKRTERLREENIDLFRKKHNEAQKKHRQKKKGKVSYEQNLDKIEEYWQGVKERREEVVVDGFNYGKRQMEKTLAMIPKIDVNLEGREKNE